MPLTGLFVCFFRRKNILNVENGLLERQTTYFLAAQKLYHCEYIKYAIEIGFLVLGLDVGLAFSFGKKLFY